MNQSFRCTDEDITLSHPLAKDWILNSSRIRGRETQTKPISIFHQRGERWNGYTVTDGQY